MFRYLGYPRNRAFLGEDIAISKPTPPTNLKGLYFVSKKAEIIAVGWRYAPCRRTVNLN